MAWTPSANGCRPVVVLALLATGLGACAKGSKLGRYDCQCAFLTDTDDSSSQRVEVCAYGAAEANEVAHGCAQSAAPAPIQDCRCQPAERAARCTERSCLAHAHR